MSESHFSFGQVTFGFVSTHILTQHLKTKAYPNSIKLFCHTVNRLNS